MALIKKIRTNSRNGDISTLLTLILKALADKNWRSDTYLTLTIEKISAANTALIQAYKRLTIYSQMAEKDRIRDMAIRDLFSLVKGYIHMPIAEIKEAALHVNPILERYGLQIQKMGYAAESGYVMSLLNDLGKADIAPDIIKLQGVPQTITALTVAQKDFENVALQQAETKSAKKKMTSASELKKTIITEINTKLVDYMNTMAKVKPDTYGTTAYTIAQLIDKNNDRVKRRRKIEEVVNDNNL